jgi:hypothetical protein
MAPLILNHGARTKVSGQLGILGTFLQVKDSGTHSVGLRVLRCLSGNVGTEWILLYLGRTYLVRTEFCILMLNNTIFQ